MAGKGTRTQELGEFKPFIKVAGKHMFEWMLRGIKNNISSNDELVFITTEYFSEKYNVKETIQKTLSSLSLKNNYHLVATPHTPPGPAATVYTAREYVDENTPVIVVNTDQYISFDTPRDFTTNDGFLPVYVNFSPQSSYVCIRKENIVSKIVEKNPISHTASAGVYATTKASDLFGAIEYITKNNVVYKDEYYLSDAIEYLIEQGKVFTPMKTRAKFDLGNPKDIAFFESIIDNLL